MKDKDNKNDWMVWIICIIIVFGVFFTVPLSNDNIDVTFTATIQNNAVNHPEIISMDVQTKKSTLIELPQNLQIAGIFDIITDVFKSGDMEIVAEIGDRTTSKNIEKLYMFDETKVTLTLQKVPLYVNGEENDYFEVVLYEKLDYGRQNILYVWSGYI